MSEQNGSSNGAEAVHLPGQPKNFLRPCLLLLLGEEAAYGYELRDKLAPLSPNHWDQGTVYRTLNTMEDDGLVVSSWERSAEGPRRRRYNITRAGIIVLDTWAHELSGVRDLIVEFLDRYQHDRGLVGRAETAIDFPSPPASLATVTTVATEVAPNGSKPAG